MESPSELPRGTALASSRETAKKRAMEWLGISTVALIVLAALIYSEEGSRFLDGLSWLLD